MQGADPSECVRAIDAGAMLPVVASGSGRSVVENMFPIGCVGVQAMVDCV